MTFGEPSGEYATALALHRDSHSESASSPSQSQPSTTMHTEVGREGSVAPHPPRAQVRPRPTVESAVGPSAKRLKLPTSPSPDEQEPPVDMGGDGGNDDGVDDVHGDVVVGVEEEEQSQVPAGSSGGSEHGASSSPERAVEDPLVDLFSMFQQAGAGEYTPWPPPSVDLSSASSSSMAAAAEAAAAAAASTAFIRTTLINTRPVIALDRDTKEALCYFSSIKCAGTRLGIDGTYVLKVVQLRQKSYRGFGWRFASQEEQEQGHVDNEVSGAEMAHKVRAHINMPVPRPSPTDNPVVVVDKDSGEALRYYSSLKLAAARLGATRKGILGVCQLRNKSCRGLGWRYAKPEEGRSIEEEVSEAELKLRMEVYVPVLVKRPSLSDRPVMLLDLDSGAKLRYYASVKDVVALLGIGESGVVKVCQGRGRSCAGFSWRYATEEEDGSFENEVSEEEIKHRMEQPSLSEKAIIVCDKDTGVPLRYYPSLKEGAARLRIVNKGDIVKVVMGKYKSCSGFSWRNATEEEQQLGRVENESSEEQLRKIMQVHNRGPVLVHKPVVVMDRGNKGVPMRLYDSIKTAGKRLGIVETHILQVCQQRKKSYKGFGWRYARPEEVEKGRVKKEVSEAVIKRRMEAHIAPPSGPVLIDLPVMVVDRDAGTPLRYYETIREAAEHLNLEARSILGVCQQKNKSCKGFGWRFATIEDLQRRREEDEVSENELRRRIELLVSFNLGAGRWPTATRVG